MQNNNLRRKALILIAAAMVFAGHPAMARDTQGCAECHEKETPNIVSD